MATDEAYTTTSMENVATPPPIIDGGTNQTFAGFIAAGSKIATDPHIAMLTGKIIGITGAIELHQGKPEIKVMSPDQIKP